MRQFRWLSAQDIPPEYDLRRRGWLKVPNLPQASPTASPQDDHLLPALMPPPGDGGPRQAANRHPWRSTVLLGIDCSAERARLLALGFGEVLPAAVALDELAVRVGRVAQQAHMQPAHRDLGPLRLDLMARDGYVGGRALGLHPREFALLWRLAETPGAPLAKPRLLADVWRLSHIPETNTLAVHVARLRRKLDAAGVAGLIQTTPDGGYALVLPEARPAIPLDMGNGMDAHVLAD